MRMATGCLGLAVAMCGCQAATREQVGAVEVRVAALEQAVARVGTRVDELAGRIDALAAWSKAAAEARPAAPEPRDAVEALLAGEKRRVEEERKKLFEEREREAREARKPTVPYIVNPKSEAPTVNLWRDAERSDKMPISRVPKGTKCKIVDSKDLDLLRGGTMYLVQAVTGERGWLPHFCIEYRHR